MTWRVCPGLLSPVVQTTDTLGGRGVASRPNAGADVRESVAMRVNVTDMCGGCC
jgi:hypothetical protein